MRIIVVVDTGEADQGYQEGEEPTFESHKDDIQELLRSGYYEIAYISQIGVSDDSA